MVLSVWVKVELEVELERKVGLVVFVGVVLSDGDRGDDE